MFSRGLFTFTFFILSCSVAITPNGILAGEKRVTNQCVRALSKASEETFQSISPDDYLTKLTKVLSTKSLNLKWNSKPSHQNEFFIKILDSFGEQLGVGKITFHANDLLSVELKTDDPRNEWATKRELFSSIYQILPTGAQIRITELGFNDLARMHQLHLGITDKRIFKEKVSQKNRTDVNRHIYEQLNQVLQLQVERRPRNYQALVDSGWEHVVATPLGVQIPSPSYMIVAKKGTDPILMPDENPLRLLGRFSHKLIKKDEGLSTFSTDEEVSVELSQSIKDLVGVTPIFQTPQEGYVLERVPKTFGALRSLHTLPQNEFENHEFRGSRLYGRFISFTEENMLLYLPRIHNKDIPGFDGIVINKDETSSLFNYTLKTFDPKHFNSGSEMNQIISLVERAIDGAIRFSNQREMVSVLMGFHGSHSQTSFIQRKSRYIENLSFSKAIINLLGIPTGRQRKVRKTRVVIEINDSSGAKRPINYYPFALHSHIFIKFIKNHIRYIDTITFLKGEEVFEISYLAKPQLGLVRHLKYVDRSYIEVSRDNISFQD